MVESLPRHTLIAGYEHDRLATIAYNNTAQLLESTRDIRGRGLLLRYNDEVLNGRLLGSRHVIAVMSEVLGDELLQQVQSELFRRGSRLTVSGRLQRNLVEAWKEYRGN